MKLEDKMKRRVRLALEKEEIELVLRNCKIINVFTHTVEMNHIAIDDGKIIGIGEYKGKKEIDLQGQYVAPGLIDSHVHLESSLVVPEEFAKIVLSQGTTTVIADPHEIANVCGLDGIKYMMNASAHVPLNVFFMLPSAVPATPYENAGATLNKNELKKLIDHPKVLGLGELMNFPGVLNASQSVIEKMTLADRKIIDGHAPGLLDKELNAYMINGIRTDHECSTLEEMHQRLSRGMYVLIREGSAARNLDTLLEGVNEENSRRCLFCTDDKNPEDILKEGHINYNVNQAITKGLDPITAIQMATINAAECYNLRDIGAIAPGYDADLIIFDSLDKIQINKVYKKGKIVAASGKSTFDINVYKDTNVLDTVKFKKIRKEDLKIELATDIAKVIAVLPHNLITKKVIRKVSRTISGEYINNTHLDISKAVVIERHSQSNNIGLGLVEDFGIKNGAIATTISHDSHNVIAIGDNDQDMVIAINEIRKIQGGIVIVSDGEVVEKLALPIAGLISDKSLYEVKEIVNRMTEYAYNDLNVNPEINPFMTLSFLALPVIPDIKLTDRGLFDVNEYKFIDINI